MINFIGAIKPKIGTCKFLTPVFEDSENIRYTSLHYNELIIDFSPIKYEFILLESHEKIEVKVGSENIFCYYTKNLELVYGIRQKIQLELFEVYATQNINEHAKLVLSSFLGMYSTSLKLITSINHCFEKNSVKDFIDDSLIFKNKKLLHNKESNKIPFTIKRKIKYLKKNNLSFKIEDIFFFNKDKVYFENTELEAGKFILMLSNSDLKNNLNQVLNICSIYNKLDIKKVIKSDIKTYEYFLFTKELILDQYNVEQFLSGNITNAEQNKRSIIESGFEMDEYYAEMENDKITINDNFVSFTQELAMIDELKYTKESILTKFNSNFYA